MQECMGMMLLFFYYILEKSLQMCMRERRPAIYKNES